MVNIENQMQLFEFKVLQMAHLSYEAMEEATELFKTFDKTLALELIEQDQIINEKEVEINNLAIEILSLLQPVAKDLRFILGGIKIANDLERISDYAKNMAKYVLKNENNNSSQIEAILNLQMIFMKNFKEIIVLLEQPSTKEAFRCAELDEILDQEFISFSNTIIDALDQSSSFPLPLFNISRTIERAGDHAKNICEQIIYTLEGKIIDFG